MLFRICLYALLTFTASVAAWAGQASSSDSDRPRLRAVRLQDGVKINIDGRLDEAAWQHDEAATDFRQSDPNNGEPATERTEIRVMFNRDHLYIGAQFFDSEPDALLGNQMVRDGFLSGDDRFMWVLDPFNDQRSGYFFEINPSGAMGDSQLVPAQGSGFGVGQNRAWDGIWLARVGRHDEGWTAEIEIPFRTLNFDPNAEFWGANFQRTVRRKNEESFWTGWGRNQGLMNLVYAGRIEGITDVTQGYGLDIKPYLIGAATQTPAPELKRNYKGDAGLDLFYNLTPQLKANITVNTDFAQTEVDDRQVNLTRFPLFFPEKRDFFLDGAGNFDFAREPSDFTAFFTRRIGLDQRGRPQPIDYGVKLGGQVGQFNVGLMHVRTGGVTDVAGEDFTVFRPKRRFFRQSYAGLIYTRRAAREGGIPDRHTVGGDFELATTRFRGSQNLQFSGFFLKTPDGATDENAAYGFRLNYPNDLWNARISYREVQRNHDPAIGFVERRDYRRVNPVVRFGPRPRNNRWVRQVSMETWMEMLTDTQNQLIGRSFRFTLLDLNLHSQDSINIQISPAYERLERDFRLGDYLLPQGNEYRFTRYSFSFNTANRRMISGNANATVGSFYSGRRRDVSIGLNLRPRRGVLATFTSQFNRIELAEGSLSTKILRAVINTQFNPFISVSNNVQYDSVSRVLGWQARFRWIVKPGNDIYFVWLNNWLDAATGLASLDRSAAAKVVYTMRL